jgi:hypothetical protein
MEAKSLEAPSVAEASRGDLGEAVMPEPGASAASPPTNTAPQTALVILAFA